jgi:hypothetical protein
MYPQTPYSILLYPSDNDGLTHAHPSRSLGLPNRLHNTARPYYSDTHLLRLMLFASLVHPIVIELFQGHFETKLTHASPILRIPRSDLHSLL